MADGSVSIKIKGDSSEYKKSLGEIKDSTLSVFKGIMASKALSAGFNALKSALTGCMSAGMSFEAAMSQVAAISGATADDLERLTEAAEKAGSTTQFTATQAANALNYMALAGWDANQSIEALDGVLGLAAASGMDLASASDMVTDYISAFGMEAKDAAYMADLMAYAQANSNTSAAQLGQAYGNCAASMHAAGQDIETTTAMLEALANQGIKGAEAGTQMAAIVRDLTQKMEDGYITIGKTKVQVADAEGNFRDLNAIMADVAAATDGMGTAEASAALMETFTARSVKAVQTILNEGVGTIDGYEEALRGSVGTAAEQSEQMLDNLQGDVQIAKSAIEGLQITAYDSFSGIARAGVQEFTEVVNALNDAGKKGGMTGMLDSLTEQIPVILAKVSDALSKAFETVGKRLPQLMKNLVKKLPDFIKMLSVMVPGLVSNLFEVASAALEGLIEQLPELVPQLAEGLLELFTAAAKGALRLFGSVFNGIENLLKDAGWLDKDLNDYIREMVASVDISGIEIKDIELPTIDMDGEVDVETYKAKIEQAKKDVQSAINGLDLTEEEQEALVNAIYKGSGGEALELALVKLGAAPADASTAVTAIDEARENIDTALGKFKLSPAVYVQIFKYVAAGGSVETALTKFAGLSADDAKTAANDVSDDINEIIGIYNSLDLDISFEDFVNAISTTKGDLAIALSLLGMTDGEIEAALSAAEIVANSISTRIEGVFNTIKKAFTNGKMSDDEEARDNAIDELTQAGEDMDAQIDSWLTSYKEKLDNMNLSAEDYETAVNNAEAKAATMKAEVAETIASAVEWVNTYAGAATDTVKAHVSELESLQDRIEEIEAELDGLNASMDLTSYRMREAVVQGYATSTQSITDAMNLTNTEYQAAMDKAALDAAEAAKAARDKYNKAMDEAAAMQDQDAADALRAAANEQLSTDEAQIEATQKAAEEEATRIRDAWMQGIIAATTGNDADLEKAFAGAKLEWSIADTLQWLYGNSTSKTAPAESYDELRETLGLDEGTISLMAAMVGESKKEFKKRLLEAYNSSDFDDLEDMFAFKGASFEDIMSDWLTGFFEDGTIDPSQFQQLATILKVGFENGWLEGLEGIDLGDDGTVDEKVASAMKSILTNGIEEYMLNGPEKVEVPVEVEPAVIEPDDGAVADEAEKGKAQVKDKMQPLVDDDPLEIEQPVEVATSTVEVTDSTGTGTGSGIQEAVEDKLEKQTVGVDVNADVSVNVNVTDSNATEIGISIGEELGTAIGDGLGQQGETVSNAVSNVADEVKDVQGKFNSAGKFAGQGFALGLLSRRQLIIDTAKRIANDAAQAIKDALKIESPSKVMMSLGQYTGEGFDIGLQRSLSEAVANMNSLVTGANMSPKMDLSGITNQLNMINEAQNEGNIVLQLNGRELGRAAAPDMNTAVNGYTRRIAMGYGRG